ncbi:MAG: DNA topoisomerase I [Candidatus Woesearchaeota archaeon]
MRELIITEKPNSAKKIAAALANGSPKQHRSGQVSYFELERDGKTIYVAATVGHIYGLDEKEKSKRSEFPVFDIEWKPSAEVSRGADYTKKYLDVLIQLAKQADEFTVATDYDIEGEVIGYNIIRYAAGQDDANRMKFSTLTSKELKESYEKKMKHLDWPQALAGETRHVLDWYYGINLSRALTAAIRKGGIFKIMSTGRVQAPALKIVSDKEREIRAFIPTPYWEIEAALTHEKHAFGAKHATDRFLDEDEAKKAYEKAKDAREATVTGRDLSEKKLPAPYPFDLTTLQTEAYALFKIKPAQTLEVAQELYSAGLISYPRTSSQQLPASIGYANVLRELAKQPSYKDHAAELLALTTLTPNNGKKSDPAHPAIYPTGNRAKLDGWKQKIYDLIVKRFFATFGQPATRATVTLSLDIATEPFISKGSITTDPQWMRYYAPYARFKDEELPAIDKDAKAAVEKVDLAAKETQPPRRYTPASLVKELEKRGLGTKATRSAIIETLYERAYIKGDSIEVTDLGLQTSSILEKYFPKIVDEELTRSFEEQMDTIREDRKQQNAVLEKARATIVEILGTFKDHEKELGEELVEAVKSEEYVCPCPTCESAGREGSLRLRSGKYGAFIGCSNYPECSVTINVPRARYFTITDDRENGWPIAELGDKKSELQRVTLTPELDLTESIGPCLLCKAAGREDGELQIRQGRYGRFIGCSNYPECKHTVKIPRRGDITVLEKTDAGWPVLEVEMRKDQREELSTNPERHVKETHPLEGTKCPTCQQGTLVLRSSFYGKFLGCSRYPKCKNLTKLDKDGNVVEGKSTESKTRAAPKSKTKSGTQKPAAKKPAKRTTRKNPT